MTTSSDTSTPTPSGTEALEYDIEVEAVKGLVCPRCEAKLNEHCVTVSGAKAGATHTARTEPLYKAYAVGVQRGKAVGSAL